MTKNSAELSVRRFADLNALRRQLEEMGVPQKQIGTDGPGSTAERSIAHLGDPGQVALIATAYLRRHSYPSMVPTASFSARWSEISLHVRKRERPGECNRDRRRS